MVVILTFILIIHSAISVTGISSTLPTNLASNITNNTVDSFRLDESKQLDVSKQEITDRSFIERISDWFGFGDKNTDSKVNVDNNNNIDQSKLQKADKRHYTESSATDTIQNQCNSCNNFPWVPIFFHPHYIVNKQKVLNYPINQPPIYVKPKPIHYPSYPFVQTLVPINNINKINYNPIQLQKQQQQHQQQQHQQQHPIIQYQSEQLFHQKQPEQFYKNNKPFYPYSNPAPLYPVINNQKYYFKPHGIQQIKLRPILPPIYNPKSLHYLPASYNNNINNKPSDFSNYGNYGPRNTIPKSQPNPIIQHSTLTKDNSDFEVIKSTTLSEFTETVNYSPNLIESTLIDLSQVGTNVNEINSIDNSLNESPKAATTIGEYISEPIIVSNLDDFVTTVTDSYSSATSENLTTTAIVQDQHRPVENYLRSLNNPETNNYVTPSFNNLNTFDKKKFVQTFKKDRETPKHLLDSPIYYFKKTTENPNPIITSYSNGLYNSDEQYLTKFIDITSPMITKTTEQPQHLEHPNINEQRSVFSSTTWTPETTTELKKKPKQIIIPYTTSSAQSTQSASNSYINNINSLTPDLDYFESQEAKIVTSRAILNPSTFSTVKPVINSAYDRMKLLGMIRKEAKAFSKSSNLHPKVDFTKLQKNIDIWTEQEYSQLMNKPSTISLPGISKRIPTQYLTTEKPSQEHFISSSTTSLPNYNTNYTIIEENDDDVDYIKTIQPEPFVSSAARTNNITLNSVTQSTTIDGTAYNDVWTKLNVTISPITHKKIYVVTPLPIEPFSENEVFNDFSSPRFKIRPTIGSLKNIMKLTSPEKINRLLLAAQLNGTNIRDDLNRILNDRTNV